LLSSASESEAVGCLIFPPLPMQSLFIIISIYVTLFISTCIYFFLLERLGCWNEGRPSTLPNIIGNFKGSAKPKVKVMACAHRALKRGSTVFAMQNGSQCRIDAKRKRNPDFKKYGKSNRCTKGLVLGGFRANYVFRIKIQRKPRKVEKRKPKRKGKLLRQKGNKKRKKGRRDLAVEETGLETSAEL